MAKHTACHIQLPEKFSIAMEIVINLLASIEFSPINPYFNKIHTFNRYGNEIFLDSITINDILEKKISLINFWKTKSSNFVLKWTINDKVCCFEFSEIDDCNLSLLAHRAIIDILPKYRFIKDFLVIGNINSYY